MYANRNITVIIPALNESPGIAKVVESLFELRVCGECGETTTTVSADSNDNHTTHNTCTNINCRLQRTAERTDRLVDQIIVCDNGSTDDTALVAKKCGAIVTHEPEQGYGAACLAALAVPVEKDIVVFVDGDQSVVATELPLLIEPLLHGADLVIGSRVLGHTERGALSIPQQFGNTLASFLIRRLWSASVTDLGPFRATTQSTLNDLCMTDQKFGWTVEMQVRALQQNKQVIEVPVSTRCRVGQSKISGTMRGVIGAGHGILSTIFKLYLSGTKKNASPQLSSNKH